MAKLSSPDTPPRLSDLIEPTTRRGFLVNASVLSLAIPGVGAAIVACSPGVEKSSDTSKTAQAPAAGAQGAGSPTLHNPDSRLDTSLLKGGHPSSSAEG
ncbi:MAG TPA: hypothetical protein VFC35_04070, partial [Gemmatimonadaceae bacterium]|nr:hypothetical protein [Gemmatimonadaceae bacterium]